MSPGLWHRHHRIRIVVSEFISLDGVVQAPGSPDEDKDGDFQHGGWSMPAGALGGTPVPGPLL